MMMDKALDTRFIAMIHFKGIRSGSQYTAPDLAN